MQFAHPAQYNDPLDLLRRFIPTPLRTRFRSGRIAVLVDANDFSLLPTLPLESASENFDSCTFTWKLVRDADVPGVLQKPLVLLTGELTVVTMGPPCFLALDHKLRKLVCFIGAEVDSKTFREYLVPFLCRLSAESLEPPVRETVAGINEDTVDA
jgi:hypothetical protein